MSAPNETKTGFGVDRPTHELMQVSNQVGMAQSSPRSNPSIVSAMIAWLGMPSSLASVGLAVTAAGAAAALSDLRTASASLSMRVCVCTTLLARGISDAW